MNRYLQYIILSIPLASCAGDPPQIVGAWVNGYGQQLVVLEDLTGLLTQTTSCAPDLAIFAQRDPYDAFSIRFAAGQNVFFPEPIAEQFLPNQFFCSSRNSTPMCSFCKVEGSRMPCTSDDQTLVRIMPVVRHNCDWSRLDTFVATSTRGCAPLDAESNCATGGPTQ